MALLVRPRVSIRPCCNERFHLVDVRLDLECDVMGFSSTEALILSFQGFSTIPCVISAFPEAWRRRGINFAIQNGLQFFRSTFRWFDHN